MFSARLSLFQQIRGNEVSMAQCQHIISSEYTAAMSATISKVYLLCRGGSLLVDQFVIEINGAIIFGHSDVHVVQNSELRRFNTIISHTLWMVVVVDLVIWCVMYGPGRKEDIVSTSGSRSSDLSIASSPVKPQLSRCSSTLKLPKRTSGSGGICGSNGGNTVSERGSPQFQTLSIDKDRVF